MKTTTQTGTPVYYTYQNDHLGTPQKLLNQSGAVVWSATYDAFGKASVDAASIVTNNLRFPGQYADQETGLHYNWNRYYDPKSGRYISSDPIGLRGGVNTYTYVGGNPIGRIDPFGLVWQFSQSTGQWSYVDDQTGAVTPIGPGYSGNGNGRNNPAMQSTPNVGPTPQGTYNIGAGHYSPNTGPNTMNLTPQPGTDTFGRDLIRIHGNNATNNASHGCAIAGPDIRNQINNSTDRVLNVIP
jgi:RHS repeat-associated protein